MISRLSPSGSFTSTSSVVDELSSIVSPLLGFGLVGESGGVFTVNVLCASLFVFPALSVVDMLNV